MANEYRIYQITSEVAHSTLGGVQVYGLAAEVAHDGAPLAPIQVYNIVAEVVRDIRDKYSVETTESTSTVFDGFAFRAPLSWAPIGVGDDSIPGGFSFSPDKFTIGDRERNPYPSHTSDDLERFLAEQQRIIREQHNKTQAGDSTFDYGLLLKGTPNQLYTLGSVGRFYHDRLGIIVARYVKFRGCIETAAQGAPVGYFKTSKIIDWTVTNDFSKSGADLVMGVMCLAETPDDDTFGWIVTEGPVPVIMNQVGGILPAPETPYVWVDDGDVNVGVAGKILGRRWGKAISPPLAAGTFYVRLEGLSPASFIELISQQLAPINETLAEHETRLDTAETNITNLQTGASQLTHNLTTLTQRLATEEAARVRDIASVRALITSGTDWGSAIVAGDNVVRSEYQEADNALRILISAAQYRADEAYARTGGDLPGLTADVAALNTTVANIYSRIANFTLDWDPQAEGQVLISINVPNADGNPQWFWIGADFVLENLGDVDVTTTPPTDGQVLKWVAADSLWKPADDNDSGGGGGGTPWYFDPPAAADFTAASTDATVPTLTDDSDVGLIVDFGTLVTGPVRRYVWKALPSAGAANWELIVRIQAIQPGVAGCLVGLFLYESATGKNLGVAANSGAREHRVDRSTTLAGTLTAISSMSHGQGATNPKWLKLAYDHGSTTYSWSTSWEGKFWAYVASNTIAATTPFTTRADRIGFVSWTNVANANWKVGLLCDHWDQDW